MISPAPHVWLASLLLAVAGSCGHAAEPLLTLRGHTNAVYSVAFSGDGRIASGGMDRTVRIWRLDPSTARPDE